PRRRPRPPPGARGWPAPSTRAARAGPATPSSCRAGTRARRLRSGAGGPAARRARAPGGLARSRPRPPHLDLQLEVDAGLPRHPLVHVVHEIEHVGRRRRPFVHDEVRVPRTHDCTTPAGTLQAEFVDEPARRGGLRVLEDTTGIASTGLAPLPLS